MDISDHRDSELEPSRPGWRNQLVAPNLKPKGGLQAERIGARADERRGGAEEGFEERPSAQHGRQISSVYHHGAAAPITPDVPVCAASPEGGFAPRPPRPEAP